MKKIKNVFIYVLIYTICVLLLEKVFNIFNLAFRSWFIMVSILLIVIGLFISLVQLFLKIKKKVIKYILLILCFIIVLPVMAFSVYFTFLSIDEEFVVTKYDKKMIAKLHSFFSVDADYYDYKNFLLRGNTVRIHEYYGEGGFNPFDEKIINKYGYKYLVHSGTYFDKDGNMEGKFSIPIDKIENNAYYRKPIEYTKEDFNKKKYNNGVIYKIDNSKIYFYNEGLGQGKLYYILKDEFEFYNGRTSMKMDKEEIRLGDHLYIVDEKMSILRTLSGDYLKNELLTNFTLQDQLIARNSVEFDEIEIIDDKTANVKVTFGDIVGDTVTAEKFTMTVKFDKNTKYLSKGNTVTSVKELENVKYDINSIVLDKNTINNENVPVVSVLDSYGG